MAISVRSKFASWLLPATLLLFVFATAQKPGTDPPARPRPVVFAVLEQGTRIEPIGVVVDGSLVEPAGDEVLVGQDIASLYYKPKTSYPIIFGGAASGSVSVVKSNIGEECGGNSATTVAKPGKAKLTGMVMAIATDLRPAKASETFRRRPTAAERTAIEEIVRKEFKENGASAASVKSLRYHNLTAVDLDADDLPEFIGSYWIASSTTERRLLFFIADNTGGDRLSFTVSEHDVVKLADVMSGDLKDLETGVGHELLLDVFDLDGDGVREVFTVGRGFEGSSYYAYKRSAGRWSRVYEASVYRCAY